MDLQQIHPINLAAFAMSAAALGFSALALFPGLKGMLQVVRDAVLWLALFFVLGGAAFFGWQQLQKPAANRAEVTELPQPAPGFGLENTNRQ